MPENEIYAFLKQNNLTSKGEAEFTKEYSDPKKAEELHNFFVENKLTTKDSASFYETYFAPEVKKKEESKPTTEKAPTSSEETVPNTFKEAGVSFGASSPSKSTFTSGTDGTKTVEELNAKFKTAYTDLEFGKKSIKSAEKSVLVPFSPIKVKQQSTLEDYIAPKIDLPDFGAPMKRYENAYKSINSRIDIEGKKFESITLEIEKQEPQVQKGLQQFENELKQASDIIQKELSAKFQPMVDSKKMTVEQANAQFKAEYDKGYDIAQTEITKKYSPALNSYNKLIEDRKTIGNGIKTDVERAKLLANSVNIIDRNQNAQQLARESNFQNAMKSGKYGIGSILAGTLPYSARVLNNNLSEYALKNNMPELAKIAYAKQDEFNKSELYKAMEDQAKEWAKKGQYYSQKIEEKEGTVLDNFEAGNYAKAVKVAGIRFTESIPVMAAAIGMVALTRGSTVAAIPLGGFAFGSQNYYGEYADRMDMSESDKLGASYIKGSLEMATEVAILPILSPLKNLIKTSGKEAAKEAIKKTLFGTIKAGYEKYLPAFGWIQEGGSEYVNEVAATITDKLYDPKFQDKDWNTVLKEGHRRGLEAFGPGAFGGGAFTLPTLINNGLNKYQSKLEARGYEKELSQIDMDIANPSLPVEAKNILIDRKKELHQKLNKAFDADKQDTAGATTEQLSLLDDINDRRDVIENALLDETLTPESKKAFEEDKKKLELEEKDVLDQIKANEVVDEKEKVKGKTEYYQGTDFNTQTGLPNGNYTEQEVAAARLPIINAQIAKLEAAKEEVGTKILDEKKRLEGVLEKGKEVEVVNEKESEEQIKAREERISEIQGMLASDNLSMQEKGGAILLPEARQELLAELEQLKKETETTIANKEVDIENQKKLFTEAGEQSKKDQSPKALGNFIIDSSQVGDKIIVNENEYFEVVSKKTNKKGNTETELQHFVKNEETGEFENNPSAVKFFTDKYRGTNQEKLGYRDASDLFENTYTNAKGERITEQSTYEPKTTNQNDKENIAGVQGNIGEGKEPIKTKPNETTGGEKVEASGNVQASEEEVAAKLQKSIDKINEQRDSELRTATGKVIYTDNPTEAEKSQRVKDKVQEINDRYNAIIEREKEKQSLKETPKEEPTKFKSAEQGNPEKTGEKIVLNGHEDLDTILVRDGLEFNIYELATGLILTEGTSFTKEDAIEEAENALKDSKATATRIYTQAVKAEFDKFGINKMKPINKSEAYEKFKAEEKAKAEKLPFLRTDAERQEFFDLAKEAESKGLKELSETINKWANERVKTVAPGMTPKQIKEMIKFAEKKNQLKKQREQNIPYNEEDKEKKGATEEDLAKAVNYSYAKDRMKDIPSDIKEKALAAYKKAIEIFNYYGYSPASINNNKENSIPLALEIYARALGSKNIEQKEQRIKEAADKIDKSIAAIDKIYEEESANFKEAPKVETKPTTDEKPVVTEEIIDNALKNIKENGKPLSEFKVGDKVIFTADNNRYKSYTEGVIIKAGDEYVIQRFPENPDFKRYKTTNVSKDKLAILKPKGEPNYGGDGYFWYLKRGEEEKAKDKKEGEETVLEFENRIEKKYKISLDLYDYKNGDLVLSNITVPFEKRNKGIGKKAMQEIIDYADKVGRRITLTPSTSFGATSVGRLEDFYKQFGFIKNAGKNKDFTTRETMYRLPYTTEEQAKTPAEAKEKPTTKATESEAVKAGVLPRIKNAFLKIGTEIFDNAKALMAKAKELAGEGGNVQYNITMPDGTQKTVKPVNADVVNGFYSPLEKVINEVKQDKMPAKQWIEKFAKGEEAKITGLTDWLSSQPGSVSKADIQNYLKDNRIEVVEVVKGEATSSDILNDEQLKRLEYLTKLDEENPSGAIEDIEAGSYDELLYLLNVRDKSTSEDLSRLQRETERKAQMADRAGNKKLSDKLWNDSHRYTARLETLELSEEGQGGISNPTKFSQYQLEGEKENYKEILVTLPKKKLSKDEYEKNYYDNFIKKGVFPEWSELSENDKQEIAATIPDYAKTENTKFKSTHFDEANILVHLRMNTRTDSQGNKVLFLEEVQSDWGQQGKREGFANEKNKKESERLKKEIENLSQDDLKIPLSPRVKALMDEADKLENESRTPSAPFVIDTNAWTKLGLKVALKEAVKQGASKLAWTTGEQQNARYDLSKQVDKINYSKNSDGTYDVSANKNDRQVFDKSYIKENELEGIVGKDVAQKIINDEGKEPARGSGEYKKSISGEGLKVGGKGMKGFYGSPTEGSLGIVGNVAKSLTKQEPGTVDFSYGKGFRMWDRSTNTYLGDFKGQYTLYDKNDNITKVIPEDYQTPQEVAKELGYDYKNLEVIFTGESESRPGVRVQQSIDITPELAATVEQGQPLFHYGPKGEILGFTHNGKIYLNGEKITAKTTMEEAGHVWVNWAKENRADLYKAGLDKIAGSQYLADVMADKNYQAEALKVGEKGSEAYNAYMAEEALAKAIADEGAKFVTESKKADFKQWLAGIWKAVAKEFGIRDLSPQQVSKLTLEQFAKKVAADVFNEEPAAAMDVNERNRQIEILDNEKKIAQLEKEIRRAPVRGSKGQLSKKQLGIQLRNIKDQQRELKGLPPRKKVVDSVLNINKRKFSNVVDMSQLSFDEQLIFSAIGTLSANDKDIVSSDANKQLRQQGALVKQGGLTIDQIVTDFINENELDADMAQDFRNTLIDFVNGGDAYAWMNNIKEREAEMNPDAIRENEYYDDAYDVAMEYDLTDEEINEIELELIKQNDLTQEEYENIKNEFSNEGAEEGVVTNESETNSSEEKGPAELELEKQIEAAKNRLSEAKKELQKKEKEFGGKVFGDLLGKPKLEGALFEEELSDEVYQKAIKPYREDVVVAQRELDQLQNPKRKANAIEFDNKQNKLDLNGNLASAAAKLTTEEEAEIADLKEQLKNTKLPSQKAKIMAKIAAIRGEQIKSAASQASQASQANKNSIVPPPTVPLTKRESKAMLFNFNLRVKEILNSIGVPVAEGRLSKKYLGMFYLRNKSIRVQSLFGVATACHEAAHYISDKFGIGKAIMNPSTIRKDNPNAEINKDIRKALTDIYVEYYPGAKETHSLRLRMEEGIAVLLERYLVDPSGISQKYGLLVNNFINPTGLYYNEMFTDLLGKLNDVYSDYASLTPLEKIGTRMARGKEVLKQDTGFTWAQKNVFNWVYNGEPLRRADRTAGVQYKGESSEIAHIRWQRRAGLITPWVTGDVDSYLLTNKGWVKSGLSVKQYLTLIKGQEAEFSSYLIARRNVEDVNYQTELQNDLIELLESINDEELSEEEIEKLLKQAEELQAKLDYISKVIKNNDFDIEVSREAVEQNEARFKEAASIFDKINEAMTEFAHTTGILSAEKLAAYKNVKGYASNKRLTYDDIENTVQGGGSNSQNRIGAFKPREGSSKSIIDPVYSQIQFITETMSKGLQNTIWQNLAKLGDTNQELAYRFALQTTAPLFDPQTGKISYPQMKDKSLITVWNNGKPSFYLAGAEYLAFAETMTSKEFEAFGAILKEAATVFSRFTTTANPLFPLVNIPIDTVSAWMNTKTGFVPILSQLSTLKEMTAYGLDYMARLIRVEKWYNSVKNKKIAYLPVDDKKMFEKYLSLGGSLNNLSAYYDMTPEEMIKALNTANVLKKGYKNVKNATLGLLELPGNMSENITRFAEYKRAKEKGYSDDVAMYMAAHVSTPFIQQGNMGGRVGQAVEKSIPYFHSALQVLGKYGQQVNEDPIRVATITAGMVVIAMSSVLATLAYSDDEDKKVLAEQTTDQLSKNIWFPKGVFGGSGFIKIRIPETIGMISGAMTMAVLQQKELVKKYTPKDWLTATTVAVPSQFNVTKPLEAIWSWQPQLLKPSVEVISNTKAYPELAPIVNEGLARKLAKYEYNQYTSLYARELGAMTNMSPILIEHFVKAQFGKVPDMLLDMATEAVTGEAAPKKSMINIESKDFILRGRAFNEFYANSKAWNEKRSSIKDIKAEDGNTEGLKMNAKTFEKTKDLISLLQDKIKEGKVIPTDMKNDLYELLENLNNSENPREFNGLRSALYIKALEL